MTGARRGGARVRSAVIANALAAPNPRPELAMSWSTDRYPPAMANLPVIVRAKAIEIANALLASGHEEGRAIRMGIAAAKRWAARRAATETIPWQW